MLLSRICGPSDECAVALPARALVHTCHTLTRARTHARTQDELKKDLRERQKEATNFIKVCALTLTCIHGRTYRTYT